MLNTVKQNISFIREGFVVQFLRSSDGVNAAVARQEEDGEVTGSDHSVSNQGRGVSHSHLQYQA